MDLSLEVAAGDCFIVGGPQSESDNENPDLDIAMDFDPNLEKDASTGQGVALFLGDAAAIEGDTMPIDAVIYGGNNDSLLLDAEGNTPAPHVGDAPDQSSIRRTSMTPTWVIESDPMPNVCPPF